MSKITIIASLIRPHQWVKNGFVAAPLLFTPSAMQPENVWAVIWGALCFCAVSSAIYCLNDIIDTERDRQHPIKKNRPVAAALINSREAALIGIILGVAGFISAYALSQSFAAIIGAYAALNVAYCLWLKNYSIIDIMVIAAGFVLRIYAGSALIGQAPSIWIIQASALLALFLALAKRRDDLANNLDSEHRPSIKGYNLTFIDNAMIIVLGALLFCYVVYTTDQTVIAKLGTDQLFMTTPFVIIGILRYLQITFVEKRSGSPTLVLLTDWKLLGTVACWIAVTVGLIHF